MSLKITIYKNKKPAIIPTEVTMFTKTGKGTQNSEQCENNVGVKDVIHKEFVTWGQIVNR